MRFLIDGSLCFPSALWGTSALEVLMSGPLDIRPPLGLSMPPRFLSLDPFLEVIFTWEATLIFLAWGWGVDLNLWANLLERSSILLVKSSLLGVGHWMDEGDQPGSSGGHMVGDKRMGGGSESLARFFQFPLLQKFLSPHSVVPGPLPQLACVILSRFPPRALLSVSVGPLG